MNAETEQTHVKTINVTSNRANKIQQVPTCETTSMAAAKFVDSTSLVLDWSRPLRSWAVSLSTARLWGPSRLSKSEGGGWYRGLAMLPTRW